MANVIIVAWETVNVQTYHVAMSMKRIPARNHIYKLIFNQVYHEATFDLFIHYFNNRHHHRFTYFSHRNAMIARIAAATYRSKYFDIG